MAELTRKSRIRDFYAHPLGRDIADKVLMTMGRSSRWITNPVVANLRISHVERLASRMLGPSFVDTLLELLAANPDVPTTRGGPTERAWWKEAVFYQVYPRSFQDSDGDGVGDLAGITSRLDYLADLGVGCVWLSPVFASPNHDMGYDVSDYRAIMEEMGSMADMEELIRGCHERGMRIILDLVANHTSSEHEWFERAVADPDGPYGDYYFLRRGEPGEDGSGTPPTNWKSFFGGSAWRWIPEARRWVLRLFADTQPDLNWDNPRVRAEIEEIVQFWMAKGIDGFRMDVINYISKKEGLPEGDPFIGDLMWFTGIEHYYVGPHLHAYLRELRRRGFTRAADAEPPASTARRREADGTLGEPLPPEPVGLMVGETPGIGVEVGRLLSASERGELDMIFNFDVLTPPGNTRWSDFTYDLNYMKSYFEDYQDRIGSNDWIALFIENHDNPRIVSRVLGADAHNPVLREAVAKVVGTIMITMRGTPFIFQGQEIAAMNQDFTSMSDLRDVDSFGRHQDLRDEGATVGGAFAEILVGTRDHARVPMRWEPGGTTGFTTGEPWLPGREVSRGFTVAEQLAEPDSVLNWYKRLIQLRAEHEAFTYGEIEFVAPGARDYFAYYRLAPDGGRWLVEMNLSGSAVARRNTELRGEVVLGTTTERGQMMDPYEVVISHLP
ncbi:MAG: alpha-glucosidase [bacterium]|nr:alpha-glucosidase [bacterium]